MIDTRTTPLPVETVTPIRPSEAIRLGTLTRPRQLFGATFDQAGGACAVGAMSIGYGDRNELPYDVLSALPCPLGCEKPGRTWGGEAGPMTPAHLNDDHRWSRESIADWLESLGL